ncbi:hypothetical protein M0R45_019330 [Rubus argutus]|uniref:Uncharacterized protein n=1 Tax=Rubus argutus TaxID=59490 RepID=A0AAW1X6S3_RUBAR
MSTDRVYLSKHVIFDETSFPFLEIVAITPAHEAPSEILEFYPPSQSTLPLNSLHHTPLSPTRSPQLPSSPSICTRPLLSPPSPINPQVPSTSHLPSLPTTSLPSTGIQHDLAGLSSSSTTTLHPMLTRGKCGIMKPNPKYDVLATIDCNSHEPSCYSQAVKKLEWRQAMGEEFNALQRAGTWTLVPSTHP